MPAISIISNEETFNRLSTFKDVSELNAAVNMHIQVNRQELNKNAVRILHHIKGYSRKFKGVSFQSKKNIAEELKLSKRTVIRNCNLLEGLGIIKQYKMKRNSDFRQTSNAIAIMPFVEKCSENVTPVSHQKEELSKTNIHTNKTSYMDHSYLPSFIDSAFIEVAKPYLSTDEIYKLWLRVLILYKKSNINRPLSELMQIINKALKETFFLYKRGRVQKSLFGYFYRLAENYLAIEKRKEANVLINWLSIED